MATNTEEVVVPAMSPYMSLIARLHHSLGITSCRAEIVVLSFLSLIAHWRTRMTTTKVEQRKKVSAAKQGEHSRGVGVDSGYP